MGSSSGPSSSSLSSNRFFPLKRLLLQPPHDPPTGGVHGTWLFPKLLRHFRDIAALDGRAPERAPGVGLEFHAHLPRRPPENLALVFRAQQGRIRPLPGRLVQKGLVLGRIAGPT